MGLRGTLRAMADSRHYRALGVSSAKEDIIAAASLQGDGLFPGAFCKIIPDLLVGDPSHCMALHADGAGTKSIVAYLMYRETGDPKVFAGLAQDALVMNIDDLLCVGMVGPYAVTNTIGRHRGLIPGEAIEAVIGGYERCAQALAGAGVEISLCGGETADLGDLVRTLVVDAAVVARAPREQIIDGGAIAPGDRIVGLSSTGQATYEERPNSGMGSNGLTLARHLLLKGSYREVYPEASAPDLDDELAYRGRFGVLDRPQGLGMTVGEALLSPTRSYGPVLVKALATARSAIHGIVHCTGGGQTKCLRLGTGVRYVKDNLFAVPPLFELIREEAQLEWDELFRVFNMGHRMELIVEQAAVGELIEIARELGVEAREVGRCEPSSSRPTLHLEGPFGELDFS